MPQSNIRVQHAGRCAHQRYLDSHVRIESRSVISDGDKDFPASTTGRNPGCQITLNIARPKLWVLTRPVGPFWLLQTVLCMAGRGVSGRP